MTDQYECFYAWKVHDGSLLTALIWDNYYIRYKYYMKYMCTRKNYFSLKIMTISNHRQVLAPTVLTKGSVPDLCVSWLMSERRDICWQGLQAASPVSTSPCNYSPHPPLLLVLVGKLPDLKRSCQMPTIPYAWSPKLCAMAIPVPAPGLGNYMHRMQIPVFFILSLNVA